jgi:CHASE1-domain containing sensor protein
VRRLRLGPVSLEVRSALIAMLSLLGVLLLGAVLLCARTILYEMV